MNTKITVADYCGIRYKRKRKQKIGKVGIIFSEHFYNRGRKFFQVPYIANEWEEGKKKGKRKVCRIGKLEYYLPTVKTKRDKNKRDLFCFVI